MYKLQRAGTLQSSRLACWVALVLSVLNYPAQARDYFNPELIELDNPEMKGADLSAFESGSQIPGSYRVDVVLGDRVVDTGNIEFKAVKNATGEEALQPCLSVEQLAGWGVRTELFPDLSAEGGCARLDAIPQAATEFQFSDQRLLISVPQAALSSPVRGDVPPEMWDEGINAGMLNYSISGANNRFRNSGGSDSNNQYANLRPGINMGPWRLRNYTTWNRDGSGQANWENVYTYAQRAIIPLKAQLTAGDSSSSSDVFDSLPFRGMQLASDDDMLPDSMKGYAPVVRGIARTNAQVVVRQNGYQIYQTYVAPGAFEIIDMYPTGGAGDLSVTIKEADGSEQHFTVPFASLPVLQREGRLRYAATGGLYRSYNSSIDKTPFGQLTAIYGLSQGVTLYGGLQESDKYQSVATGLGKNMGSAGAVSADLTQAWATPKDKEISSGQSWRIRYSKNFVETGTNFAIAGYRYSTSGYYGMQEVLDSYGDNGTAEERRRNRMELTMSQSMGGNLGALMMSAVKEDYWQAGQKMESYSAGYSSAWQSISYGLTYTYSKNSRGVNQAVYDRDQQVALNVSVPLDKFQPQSWANYSMNTSKNNGSSHTLGASGIALENNALNWNVQQGYGTNGVGYTGNANANYKGTYGEMTAGYAYDKHADRFNYGLQGGVVAHSDGVTLSQPLGETNVLVKAPGVKGVGVQNQTGAKTDFRGYTLVSTVMPYRKNDVTLMTETLPDDAELELTTKTVVPTRGAIVRADYKTSVGMRALMVLTQADGRPIPFGAIANSDAAARDAFIVGNAGQVYLTGLADEGKLLVSWGEESHNQCTVKYNLKKESVINGIYTLHLPCY